MQVHKKYIYIYIVINKNNNTDLYKKMGKVNVKGFLVPLCVHLIYQSRLIFLFFYAVVFSSNSVLCVRSTICGSIARWAYDEFGLEL